MCLLINVAIPSDRHIIQKEAENKLKYIWWDVPLVQEEKCRGREACD
jgi:hypothetical protein